MRDGSEGAEDRDLRLKYMYAKSTVLSVPTTTVSVTRKKQMEMQDCFREREVEEAGRQALLFVQAYTDANPVSFHLPEIFPVFSPIQINKILQKSILKCFFAYAIMPIGKKDTTSIGNKTKSPSVAALGLFYSYFYSEKA